MYALHERTLKGISEVSNQFYLPQNIKLLKKWKIQDKDKKYPRLSLIQTSR